MFKDEHRGKDGTRFVNTICELQPLAVARSSDRNHAARSRIPDFQLLQIGGRYQRSRSEADLACRINAIGRPRCGGQRDRGRTLPSALGHRDDVLRTENPPRNGGRPSWTNRDNDPLPNRGASIALSVNTLADGRGRRGQQRRSKLVELYGGATRTARHAPNLAYRRPPANRSSTDAAIARANRSAPHHNPPRPTLSTHHRCLQTRQIPNTSEIP